jgi:O-antigen/teichoic acid export membrane protein
MKRTKTILRNTLSNIALQTFGTVTAFVLLPLLIRYFGKELFGIYVCVATLAILANFVGTALSMCLMKSVPELLAQNEHDALSHVLSALLPLSLLLHLALGAVVFTFPLYGLDWFNIQPEHHTTATAVLRIVGIATMVRFAAPISDGMLRGLEQFHLANRIQMIPVCASIAAYLLARVGHARLPAFVLTHQVGFVLAMLASSVVAWRLMPCRMGLSRPRLGALKRIWGFGTYVMVNQTADHLMYTMDKLILQSLLGPTSVTDYHVSRRTHNMSLLLVSLPLSAMLPSLARAFSTGDLAYAKRMNTTGALLYCVLVTPPLVSLALLLERFLTLWIGSDLLVHATVLGGRLFLLATIVAIPFRVAAHSLVARGRVRFLGGSKLAYATINVCLSIVLVKFMGILGVIIPTVAFWLIIHPAVMFFLARDEAYIAGRQLLQLLIPSLLIIGVGMPLSSTIDTVVAASGWTHFVTSFLATYAITTVVHALIASVFMPAAARDARSVVRMLCHRSR